MNFFGRKKKSVPAAPQVVSASGGTTNNSALATVEKMKKSISNLEKREKMISKRIDEEVRKAKLASKQGRKQQAIMCLKRKKMLEKELQKLQGAALTLESQCIALESQSVNVDVVGSMQQGAKVMKSMQDRVSIEKVEDIMDDIQEGIQTQDEVANLLGQGVDGLAMDDDDLMAELDDLDELDQIEEDPEAALLKELDAVKPPTSKVNAPPAYDSLPSAPRTAVNVDDDDDAALAELQAEMAM